MKEYFLMFKRTFDFRGKSSRKEFWMAVLVSSIVGILVGILALPFLALPDIFWYVAGCLGSLYEIIVFLPMLSLTVRRLHDVGRSGWFLLLVPIVFFGTILLLVWLAQPSSFRVNPWYKDYNQNPDEIVLNEDGSSKPADVQYASTTQNTSTKVLGEKENKTQVSAQQNDSLEKIIDELNQMYIDKKISKQEYEEIIKKLTTKK